MNIVVFLTLVFPVLLGGLSFFLIKTGDRTLKLILAFGGAFLLSLSFIELIPEIFSSSMSETIGLWVLLGFFIQILLDFLTKGVEHGHHNHHEHEIDHGHAAPINPFGIMIGICIHSFLEGMPLAENFDQISLKNTLLSGIVIHNIPISIVLMSVLMQSGMKKSWAIVLLFIFAMSTPLGTITSYIVGESFQQNLSDYFSVILAVVVGIFLHISTTILFENDQHHRFNLYKFIAILLGASIAVFSLF